MCREPVMPIVRESHDAADGNALAADLHVWGVCGNLNMMFCVTLES